MQPEITSEEFESIKKSYFNILALFLRREKIESKYVGCFLKWSAQLNLSQEDLQKIEEDFDKIPFELPKDKVERLEAIYHLVHMIYLDNIVEDIELEVAAIYAQNLGFEPYIVADLFKSIATAPFDGKSHRKVRDEVKEFLALYEKKK
ncbi:MAG: hypothetical protein ACNS60_00155 [Candidatus Cyclobacteriaceae bacterium M2_1C_046]